MVVSMQNTIIPRPELMVFGRGIPLLNHLMGVTLAKNATMCPVFWSYLLKESSHIFLLAEFMDVLHGIRTLLLWSSKSCNIAQNELILNMKLTTSLRI